MVKQRSSAVVRALACAFLVAGAACDAGSNWSGTSLTDIAQGWTGHDRLPLCRTTGPSGEDLGAPGTRYCEWQLEAGDPTDRLTGMVRDTGTVIHWVRSAPDSADQARVLDSLGAVFGTAGLQRRECTIRTSLSGTLYGSVWSSDTLAVYVGRTVSRSGRGRLQVSLGDSPAALPPTLCP